MVLINGTNVKFLINTTKWCDYDTIVLPTLINSLRAQVSNDDIVVVMGDCNTEEVTTETDYTLVKVKHNSMDFTALIGVIDNQANLGTLPDVWFYMHDTCNVGSNFITNLSSKTLSDDIRLIWNVKGLGIYKNTTLLSNSTLLNSYKSSDNPSLNENRINKHNAINYNNVVFKAINCINDLSSNCEKLDTSKVYGDTGVNRQTIYLEDLDFYKYNSNYLWSRMEPPRHNIYP
jgi:hypothetical protein